MKPYVSIDIETTGLSPASCQILEVGAVVDDWKSPIESLPKFHCYVDQGFYHGEPFALQLNAVILGKLARRKENEEFYKFLYPGEVGMALSNFLTGNKVDAKRVPTAGKNFASFDKQFLERLPHFTEWIRFNHRFYDPSMLYLDFEKDEGIPDTKTCMERAGIGGEVAHTAIEDAIVVIKLMRAAREKPN